MKTIKIPIVIVIMIMRKYKNIRLGGRVDSYIHHISSYLILSRLITFHLISSCLVSLHFILSHLISSHYISSYLILSHFLSFFLSFFLFFFLSFFLYFFVCFFLYLTCMFVLTAHPYSRADIANIVICIVESPPNLSVRGPRRNFPII